MESERLNAELDKCRDIYEKTFFELKTTIDDALRRDEEREMFLMQSCFSDVDKFINRIVIIDLKELYSKQNHNIIISMGTGRDDYDGFVYRIQS